jgi:dihydroneopterin aldolase
MTHKIVLNGLRFHAYHGVLEQERMVGNDYTIDVEVSTDFLSAMLTDHLSGTINYGDVYALVDAEMRIPSALLEHLAGRILHSIFSQIPAASRVLLRIVKHAPPIPDCHCDSMGVEIEVMRSEIDNLAF